MPRLLLFTLACASLRAQAPDVAFFEAKIRPVLSTKCYACHSSTLKAPMSGLVLDRKEGVAKVSDRLVKILSYTDALVQMPPSGKLPDAVIADFETWIAGGMPMPSTPAAAPAAASSAYKGMSLEDGRKWWAFQPLRRGPAPKVKNAAWVVNPIDAFILEKLEAKGVKPSPVEEKRTLVRRAYVDLVGYKPSYEEIEAFASDAAPDAWEALIDRLQATPQYGERWGRHWMDVARFGEDNPTSEATNPAYPYAWRYRDWIIDAVNRDVPYDRFVKLQLAADLMPGTPRDDMRALGYLGAAPLYHKDHRLSADVIGGFMTDDWDERVDAVSRGLLGLTVSCARCHDHKFDPITTKDYYGLMGVFASTMRAERPMMEVDPKVEQRYLWVQNRLFDLRYAANLLTGEASTVVGSEARVVKWKAEIETLKTEMLAMQDQYPLLVKSLEKFWTTAQRRPPPAAPAPAAPAAGAPAAGTPGAPAPVVAAAQNFRRGRINTSNEPFMNAVYEAAQFVDGSDPNFTWMVYKAGEARDFPVLLHGNVATPGEIVPRHFPVVLAKGDAVFKNGSGRLELAEKIFTDAAPLSARVMVNRVWGWHFGRPLVATPSDYGVQGEKPTHPELLDDLAARFIAHGWSLKWLNREIMMSAAYRQSSRPRADGEKVDQINSLLWRMNPRRLDAESYRDTLLRSAGRLSSKMYGPSEDAESETNVRRTVYARVSRGRLSNLLKVYDFPDPVQTSGGRDLTTTSLQQLFVMNSPFMRAEAEALAESVKQEADGKSKVRSLYRQVLSRDPSAKELDLALGYLAQGTVEQYAQVLLSSNEEIFWQ
ncbi:MAG: DUF1553 domain-containing protein [Candidatus Solibacter sp.]